MSTEATASAKLAVKVQCEKCQHVYEYEEMVVSVISSWSDTRSADDLAAECERDRTERVRAALQRKSVKDLGVKKCPHCSHMQSWMRQSQEEHRDMMCILVSVVLAWGTAMVIHTRRLIPENVWYWLSLPVTIICGVLYYRAAKRISALIRGSPESQPRQPPSSGPVEVKMMWASEVIVEKKEVY